MPWVTINKYNNRDIKENEFSKDAKTCLVRKAIEITSKAIYL